MFCTVNCVKIGLSYTNCQIGSTASNYLVSYFNFMKLLVVHACSSCVNILKSVIMCTLMY